jgi:hypothetical protein
MISLDELQGSYEISYQSTPQLEDWFEPGFGAAKIEKNQLTGIDGVGVTWNATFEINDDGNLVYKALLDPKTAIPGAGLMDKNGQMTREPQSYSGLISITKSTDELILRTSVQQGPLQIDVQFRKQK